MYEDALKAFTDGALDRNSWRKKFWVIELLDYRENAVETDNKDRNSEVIMHGNKYDKAIRMRLAKYSEII